MTQRLTGKANMKMRLTLGAAILAVCSMNGYAADAAKPKDDSRAATPKAAASETRADVKADARTDAKTDTRTDTRTAKAEKSGAPSDRDLLAHVRRAVVKDKSLSTSAHNVKMSAKAGVITLSGGVKTEEEKAKIQEIAKGVAGVSSVENKLDVKGTAPRAAADTTASHTTQRTK